MTVLPIANTTVEELSRYLLEEILGMPDLAGRGITEITVKVWSNPGQSGAAQWNADVTH
ncbi:MAG: hypothetical protein HUJ31_13515 [Pseudomonadales bacterium]|nr:hypothetical protein [Pseudomonadales bacterium]